MRLTPEQKTFYADNGFLAIENVVPAKFIDKMSRRIEELCESWDSEEARRVGMQQEAEIEGTIATSKAKKSVRKFYNLIPYEPVFREHATEGELLELVEDIIGNPICLYADQALLKPPMVGSEKMPHQDNAYFRVEPADAVTTCWCALDDATTENGCMHYLSGSHKRGLVAHEEIPGTPHLVPDDFDRDKTVAVPIKAGGVIFHHSLTLHFSPPNNTQKWRRAFVCHFVRSDATIPGKDPKELLQLS